MNWRGEAPFRDSYTTEGNISRILFKQPFILNTDFSAFPCDLPATSSGPLSVSCLFGLAPGGVCTAISLTEDAVSSYLTISPLPTGGGIFSVALSVASRRLGVTQHPALWCSDFPHRLPAGKLAQLPVPLNCIKFQKNPQY